MTSNAETSKVLTLVFTDLADSTALKTEHGDRVVHDMIEAHREHVTRLAAECAGRIIDWAGDGCFLTFETSSAGVMFALRLQQVHAEDEGLPGVRIGLHMGEVTEAPGPQGPDGPPRIDGLAVDLAARVSGLAKPGQVLMSSAVYNSARQRLGVEAFGRPILWQAHGTYELKGFDEPLVIGEAGVEGIAPLVAPQASEKAKLIKRAKKRGPTVRGSAKPPRQRLPIWAMTLIGLLLVVVAILLIRPFGQEEGSEESSTDIAGLSPITSLAVLPLDNLMNDPAQDYFADGMTEAIISELAKIKALKVISRTSVMQYKGTMKTIPEIAAELGVEGIIEGSVLRDGDDVRITVQLIHGPTDQHLWSDSYTETITSVLKLQSDIALAIAGEIKITIAPEEQERLAESHEVNPESYNAFLLGRYFLETPTVESRTQAQAFFEEATELDPNYADAWAELANAHLGFVTWGIGKPQERYPLARRAVRRALDLDQDNARAHRLLGLLALFSDRDWQEADEQSRRAIELAPNDPASHIRRGWYLAFLGENAAALREMSTALDLAPHSSEVRRDTAQFFGLLGEADRAIRMLEGVIRDDPAYAPAQHALARAYSAAGRHSEAIAMADRFTESTEGDAIGRTTRMRVYAGAGRAAEARAMLDELLAEPDLYFDPLDVAETHVMLGDLDRAFEWYEKGFEERCTDIVLIRMTAAGTHLPRSEHTDRFGQDPRYWDLVERVGFPPLPPDNPGYEAEQEWLTRKAAAEEASAPIRKIAVLPFENMMRDPEQEYFVDGMTEALITELAQIKSLQVRGRTTVMRFKGTDKSIQEIARELDVDGIIEGSVMREGDKVRITAQLIHGPSDTHRWAGTFDSTVTSIFKLHSEMALNIAREIRANLTPQEEALVAESEDVVAAAYDEFLMGKFFHFQQSPQGFIRAAEHFRRATELDPGYADAYSWFGSSLWVASAWGWTDARENMREAKAAVNTALALAPQSDAAIGELAFIRFFYDFEWSEAEQLFRKALEIKSDEMTHYWGLSWIYNLSGNREQALAEANRAVELDPFNPGALDAVGDVYKAFGDYEAEIAHRKRILDMEPDHVGHMWNLAEVYSTSGRHQQALETHAQVLKIMGRSDDAWNAVYHARAGLADRAREILAELADPAFEFYVDPFGVAMTYTALGEIDTALDWIEEAYEAHSFFIMVSQTRWHGDYLDPLRDQPRYQAIVEKMNFPARTPAN